MGIYFSSKAQSTFGECTQMSTLGCLSKFLVRTGSSASVGGYSPILQNKPVFTFTMI